MVARFPFVTSMGRPGRGNDDHRVGRDRLQHLLAQGPLPVPADGAEPFTLTYAAGPGGTLSGETTQHVIPAPMARPLSPYRMRARVCKLERWEHGQPPHRNLRWVGYHGHEPNFAEYYNLTYTSGEWETVSGSAPTQQVPAGGNGAPVTAVRNTGYVFAESWSDGRTDNPRSDLNVTADLSVTATFLRTVTLTYTASAGEHPERLPAVASSARCTPVTAVPADSD